MNNKIIIAIAVILVLLIGGGIFMLSRKSVKAPSDTASDITAANNQDTPERSSKTLKDLLAAGVPQKCAFNDVTAETDMQGTTYIASGKVRGDFTTTAEGTSSNGHTIFDGKTSYFWMDGSSTGIKMEIDPSAATSEPENQQGLDLDKTIDYSCSAWIPDQNVFTPPSDVTFNTILLPSPAGGTASGTPASGNQSQCSSCNYLSGEQKTQCLTALNCN